jgi:hypothetical protein
MKNSENQTLLHFEQILRDSENVLREARIVEQAAKRVARELQRQNEEAEKAERRRDRAAAYQRRHTHEWAVCGIRCYSRNAYSACYWTQCHHCGQPLVYFDTLDLAQADAKTKNRECKHA